MQEQQKGNPILCGVDLGSWTFKVCGFDGKIFQIMTNEANFRETPSVVGYSSLGRSVGEDAHSKINKNYQQTVRAPQRLLDLSLNQTQFFEQLKFSGTKYDLVDTIIFPFGTNGSTLRAEQVLIALLNKVKEIVQLQNCHIYSAWISVPGYTASKQRQTIRRCAEVAHLAKDINIVDEEMAIAYEYSHYRIKEVTTLEKPKNVVFIDAGYSKFSIYVFQFTSQKARMLDSEHLPCAGSKNMDHNMVEYYAKFFKEISGDKTTILGQPKSIRRMLEFIQKQRVVLSANSEYQMNIECLNSECDLDFTMRRDHFLEIVKPILQQIAQAIEKFKQRLKGVIDFHAVELIGGTSRIPALQNVVSSILGVQPSKTMNGTQAIARGLAIAGAINMRFMKDTGYKVQATLSSEIGVCWKQDTLDETQCLGEDFKSYQQRKSLFGIGCRYPASATLSFGGKGIVEVGIYYQNSTNEPIAYLRFSAPEMLVIQLDANRIVSASIVSNRQLLSNFRHLKQTIWKKIETVEQQMSRKDQKVQQFYRYKNQLQSQLYSMRSKVNDQYRQYCQQQQQQQLHSKINIQLQWIQTLGSQPPSQTQIDETVKQCQDRLNSVSLLFQSIEPRKQYHFKVKAKYDQFSAAFDKAKNKKLQVQSAEGRKMVNLYEYVRKTYEFMIDEKFRKERLELKELDQYLVALKSL